MVPEILPVPARLAYRLGYPHVGTLPEPRQRALRAFWLDGLFSALAGGLSDPYYSLYMLSLSASNAQIGLVNTLAQISGALMAIPGAIVADRTGRYRRISVLAGVISRLMWVVMAIAPWLPGVQLSIWAVIFGWVAIAGSNALGNAGWTALSAEVVPPRLRGRYFASRNLIISSSRLMAIPAAGWIINTIGEPSGFQVTLFLAFSISLVSLYYFRQLPEHRASERPERFNLRQALGVIRTLSTYKRFTFTHATMTLGVMLGGPFLNLYMADERGFSIGTIGMVTTLGSLAGVIGMRIMGHIHDRVGITRTMAFGVGVPLIPVAWLWVQHPWQAFVVNTLAALTWAGYNLGAFNLLLAATPDEHRPHYIAIHTTTIAVVGAIGPVIAGGLLDAVGFTPVLSLSTIVRALGLITFFALVREPAPPPEPDEGE